MKSTHVILLLIGCALLVYGSVGIAQQRPPGEESPVVEPATEKEPTPPERTAMPEALMPERRERQRMSSAERMTMYNERMKSMMERMGVPPEMMEQSKTLLRAPLYRESPATLYARADELNLSEEQKTQLMKIAQESRDKALAILTAEQKQKIGDMSQKPQSVVDMCRAMIGRMQQESGRERPHSMMIGPLMSALMGEDLEPAAPEEQKGETETEKPSEKTPEKPE